MNGHLSVGLITKRFLVKHYNCQEDPLYLRLPKECSNIMVLTYCMGDFYWNTTVIFDITVIYSKFKQHR